MKPLALALAALLTLLAPAATRTEAGPRESPEALALTYHETPHYRLGTNVDAATARTSADLLEAMWPQLVAFFGDAPRLKQDERLDVFLLADAQDWRTKLREDGIPIPHGAGGYYAPRNRTVYLFRQPTIYNSRQLLLHEAIHQFHFLARCNNKAPKDTWYVEGLAEHLSRHAYDGRTLSLGVIPFCSLADYPAKALDALRDESFDLAGMVRSERASERAEQWALVRFLLLGEDGALAARWRKLAKRLDAGQPARTAFERTVGDPAKLVPRLRRWLATQQEPFVPVWNEWYGLAPDAVEGTASVTSACRARQDVTEMAATLHVPEGPWKGGLLIGFESTKRYTVVLLDDRGGFRVNTRHDGRWRRLNRGAVPPPRDGTYRLVARRGAGGITVLADDLVLGTFALEGRKAGVCLEGCTLRFTDIRWK